MYLTIIVESQWDLNNPPGVYFKTSHCEQRPLFLWKSHIGWNFLSLKEETFWLFPIKFVLFDFLYISRKLDVMKLDARSFVQSLNELTFASSRVNVNKNGLGSEFRCVQGVKDKVIFHSSLSSANLCIKKTLPTSCISKWLEKWFITWDSNQNLLGFPIFPRFLS